MVEAVVHRQRNRVMEAVAYLLAIVAAEMVTMFVHPLWGIIGYAVILVTVIVRSARTNDKSQQRLVLSLALVPLIRVVDLSMSLILSNPDPMWILPAVYTPLLVAAVVVVRILGYKREEIGLSVKSLPIQLGVMSTGFLFGWLEYLILKPEGSMITQFTWFEVLPIALILVAFTGFVEEFTFRGVLQRSAVGVFGWWGIVYVSGLFALMHLGFQSWMDVAFVFGVAMFFGWVVKKTGSLLGVTLAHGITNIMLFVILPFFF